MKSRGIWDNQDWSKSDIQIAKERGITRQTANQARNRHKAPAPTKPSKRLTQRDALLAAHILLGEVSRWDSLGIIDFLPEWAQPEWEFVINRIDHTLTNLWPIKTTRQNEN